MDRVLTPQQQCLLLFFLKLPVDQATIAWAVLINFEYEIASKNEKAK